jgi:hypothetical protein
MAFGLSFGKKKSSSEGTATIDKLTDLTGSQQSTSTQSGVTDTSTLGQTNSQQATTGATSQTQDSLTSGSTTGRTTGTTTTLGGDVQDALADRIKSILSGGVTDENISKLSSQISGRSDFDEAAFVSGIVGQARNRGEQLLQEQNSAFGSNVGGVASTNSMAALMAQRGRNDLDANLAGIEAQAAATAAGINNQNIQTSVSAQTGMAGIAQALATALKGGTTTTDMTQLTDEIQQLIGKTGGITQQNVVGSETQQQNTQTNQLLQQISDVLTQQSTQETGTETQKMKGKSGGFGISI